MKKIRKKKWLTIGKEIRSRDVDFVRQTDGALLAVVRAPARAGGKVPSSAIH
jgi:hypothetical protein